MNAQEMLTCTKNYRISLIASNACFAVGLSFGSSSVQAVIKAWTRSSAASSGILHIPDKFEAARNSSNWELL